MSGSRSRSKLFIVIAVLALVALACGTSSGGSGDTDLEATAAALEATAAALSSQPTQPPAPQNPPTQAPLPPANPTDSGDDSSGAEEFDYNSLVSGDTIYGTDFDGNAESWEDGWIWFTIPDEKENFSAGVSNGFMVIELDDLYTTVYLVPDFIYVPRGIDVYVEAGFDNVGSTRNNNVSVGCRGSADGWYEYSVTSSGLWYLYKYTPDDGFLVMTNGGIAGFENETAHTIGMACIGDEITMFADGEVIRNGTFRDTSFREGQVFIAVYADNLEGVDIEFDYFYAGVP
ncbi:MAG: hypothetical protein EPO32_00390 [Anaerolineae bacterium]|nr:MAG: hypothetical protein EPO32_00390 [Anaerolineae bacterium]